MIDEGLSSIAPFIHTGQCTRPAGNMIKVPFGMQDFEVRLPVGADILGFIRYALGSRGSIEVGIPSV